MNYKKIKEAIEIAKSKNDFKLIEEALIGLTNKIDNMENSNGMQMKFSKDGKIKSIYRTYESENKLNEDLNRLIR